jgi:hypothetical protein
MQGLRSFTVPLLLVICLLAFGAFAASASATVFCKTNVETCSAENTYPWGSAFSFATSGTTVVFETVAATHKCKKAAMGMKTESTGGGAVLGQVTSMTFGECSAETGFGECKSFEVRNLPWGGKWLAGLGGSEDRMSFTETLKGKPAIRLLCAGFSCTYGSSSVEVGMPVVSGKTHVSVARELPLFEGGPLCATVLKWNADYNAPSPEALFLTG